MRGRVAACVLLGLCAGSARAELLVFDPFTDGARTNGADAFDTAWWITASSGASVDIVAGGVSGGSNPALRLTATTGGRRLVVPFPTRTLGPQGGDQDRLVLEFDFKWQGAPPAFGSGLAFGIGHDAESPYTADGAVASAVFHAGLYATLSLGGPDPFFALIRDQGNSESFMSGTDLATLNPLESEGLSDTTARSARFTYIRAGADAVTVTAEIFPVPGRAGTPILSQARSTGALGANFFTLNQFVIGLGIADTANPASVALDNVMLIYGRADTQITAYDPVARTLAATALPGRAYHLQFVTNLVSDAWADVPGLPARIATDPRLVFALPAGTAAAEYFRTRESP